MDYDEEDLSAGDDSSSGLGRSKRSYQLVTPTKLHIPDVKTSTFIQMRPGSSADELPVSKLSDATQSAGFKSDQESLLKSVLEGMIDLIRKKNASSFMASETTTSSPILMVPVIGQKLNNLGLHKTLVNYGGKMINVLKPKSAR